MLRFQLNADYRRILAPLRAAGRHPTQPMCQLKNPLFPHNPPPRRAGFAHSAPGRRADFARLSFACPQYLVALPEPPQFPHAFKCLGHLELCLNGTRRFTVRAWRGGGVATALLRRCGRVDPLYIPCTSLICPLYLPCDSLQLSPGLG